MGIVALVIVGSASCLLQKPPEPGKVCLGDEIVTWKAFYLDARGDGVRRAEGLKVSVRRSCCLAYKLV